MNTSSVHTTIVEISRADLVELSQASEKLDVVYSNILNKIQRFPPFLRSLDDGDYIVPRMVAIGAYHHGLPELEDMEEMKKAAAYHFCRGSGQSPEAVYKKVLTVTDDARSCYTDDADVAALAYLTGEDFAPMLFRDGCFLLQFMLWMLQDGSGSGSGRGAPSFTCRLNNMALFRDLFLLENQIPWVVLEALMSCRSDVFPAVLYEFIVCVGKFFQLHTDTDLRAKPLELDGGYKPAHLLALLHYHQSGGFSTSEELNLRGLKTLPPVVTSAVDLAEMGVKLTPSRSAEFKDMSLTKCPLFPVLSMPPLYISDLTACWLVNMAAFEARTAFPLGTTSADYTVSSYLTLMSMLMDREEDVHELRAKRLIQSDFTNDRTLAFFKGGLTSYAYVSDRYFGILRQFAEHKHKRGLWIAIHKFVYRHHRTIVKVLSIASVLVGIFRALFSLKQP